MGLHRSLIGPGNSRHPSNQSESNLKPIVTWSLAFSIASGSLLIFNLRSHWLLVIFSFPLVGFCDLFAFALRPSREIRSIKRGGFSSLFQNQFEIWSAGKCHSEQLMRTQSKNKRIAHRLGKRQ